MTSDSMGKEGLVSYPVVAQGKIRTLYEVDNQHLLCISSDKISAYDHVLTPEIPGKGQILTATTVHFLSQLTLPHHLVGIKENPQLNPLTDPRIPRQYQGRALVVRKLVMIPIECVARGYLTGSALNEYQANGTVCGIALPPGLRESSALPAPIFTPARKAPYGQHDENITYSQLEELVGAHCAEILRDKTLAIYQFGTELVRKQGLILADTKFEFGIPIELTATEKKSASGHGNGISQSILANISADDIILADEVLTPDSSRYWLAEKYQEGKPQESLDKQVLRNWLRNDSQWDINSATPPPILPQEIVHKVQKTYQDFYQRVVAQ